MTKIHQSLKQFQVEIDSLTSDPSNARHHDRKNIEAIKGSLSRFGQLKPIVLHANGETVIAGNGTLAAAKELEWSHIAAVTSGLESSEATAFGIADNRTAELAKWEDAVLEDLLQSLPEDVLDATGFTLDDLPSAVEDALGESEPAVPTGLEFKIVVTLPNEDDQARLMERLEKEGYECSMMVV